MERSNKVNAEKPLPGGASHIKPSLPAQPAEKKTPAAAVAAKDAPCNSNSCAPAPSGQPSGPTNVVIGNQPIPNPPWRKPGAPAWINQPAPKGGVVYDCLALNQYGCTKWTAVSNNVPSVAPRTGGSVANGPRNSSSASTGSSSGPAESFPYAEIQPLILGPMFVSDCPHEHSQSAPDEASTWITVGDAALDGAKDPGRSNAARCSEARLAASNYMKASNILECLAREYEPHVPDEISPAMYDEVQRLQVAARKSSEDISDTVDDDERRGACRAHVAKLGPPPGDGSGGPGNGGTCQMTQPQLEEQLRYVTQIANQLDKFTVKELGDEIRARGCDAPDTETCRKAADAHKFPPGCRSWPSKQAKKDCDAQQFPTQGQYEQCLWQHEPK